MRGVQEAEGKRAGSGDSRRAFANVSEFFQIKNTKCCLICIEHFLRQNVVLGLKQQAFPFYSGYITGHEMQDKQG